MVVVYTFLTKGLYMKFKTLVLSMLLALGIIVLLFLLAYILSLSAPVLVLIIVAFCGLTYMLYLVLGD